MKTKKEYKWKIFLVLLIISVVGNIYLVSTEKFVIHNAIREYYAKGFKRGVHIGFKQGLERGRECITDGIVGECEGEVNIIIELP